MRSAAPSDPVTLLLNQPVTLPVGRQRSHYMDNKPLRAPACAPTSRAVIIARVAAVIRTPQTIDAVAEATGVSRAIACNALSELCDTFRVTTEKIGRKTFYCLAEGV